jgi:hypothetical protein
LRIAPPTIGKTEERATVVIVNMVLKLDEGKLKLFDWKAQAAPCGSPEQASAILALRLPWGETVIVY